MILLLVFRWENFIIGAIVNKSKSLQLAHFKCLPHSSRLFNTSCFFLSFDGHLRENLNSREFTQPDYGKEKVTLNKHLRKSDYFAIFPSCSHFILLRNRPLLFKICIKAILTHAQCIQPKPEFSGSNFGTSLPWWERCLSKYREWKISGLHFVV